MFKRLFFFFLTLLCFRVAIAQEFVPPAQIAVFQKFRLGVNISMYENYWKKPDAILKEDILQKVRIAHRMGFTTIRLPVAFDLFVDIDSTTLKKKIFVKLAEVYSLIDSLNMNLIITYHGGQLYKKNDIAREADRIIDMWSQVIEFFKGFGYNNLFFGIYNEPRISGPNWAMVYYRMMSKFRPMDKDRYWIIGTTNYNGIDAFIHLRKIPNDDKIYYTFHFYQPYIFTHQGAPWDIEKVPVTSIPYPYNPSLMPSIPSNITNKDVLYNLDQYKIRGTRAFIRDRIKLAFEWALKNNVTLICTEVGSIKFIGDKYRDNYFRDVLDVMYEYGIPALIWDLDQTFEVGHSERPSYVPLPSVIEFINKISQFGINDPH